MGLITNQKVVLVEATNYSTHIEAYDSIPAMLKELLDSVRIADGCYGSKKHFEALKDIEQHINTIRMHMVKFNNEPDDSGG